MRMQNQLLYFILPFIFYVTVTSKHWLHFIFTPSNSLHFLHSQKVEVGQKHK